MRHPSGETKGQCDPRSGTYEPPPLEGQSSHHLQTFKIEERPYPKESELKDGEVLIENLYLSLDPAMRGWMNGKSLWSQPIQ